MPDNATRAAHATAARAAYLAAKGEPDDCDGTLIDMIADTLHLATLSGYDAAEILNCARINFEAESDGDA